MGVPLAETLMVGDDLDEDYNAAKKAGMQAVLVSRTPNPADYIRREFSEEEVASVDKIAGFEELPAWIDKYNDT